MTCNLASRVGVEGWSLRTTCTAQPFRMHAVRPAAAQQAGDAAHITAAASKQVHHVQRKSLAWVCARASAAST